MSNYLAVATATETLRTLLSDIAGQDVPGVQVKTTRPDLLVSKDQPTEINIYLYQVTPNAAYRNSDLPTRRADGTVLQRPIAALDLHYMISFYGNENELEPQRLLGSVVRTLHAQPFLTREQIRQTILNNAGFLGGSNLAEQVELVKFSPLHLSLEEFSKIWSIFYQIPYVLSVAYLASVVLIEEEISTQNALPVLTRNVYAEPFHQPVVEQIVAQPNATQTVVANRPTIPITLSNTLLIQGQRLQGGPGTFVQIDGIEIVPTSVTDTQITLPLSTTSGVRLRDGANVTLVDGLRAGVQGLQVIHRRQMGVDKIKDEMNWHRGIESNVAAFVLHPTVTPPVTAAAGVVTVKLQPAVSRPQRVVLLLNEFSATPRQQGAPPARAYSLIAKPLDQTWKDTNGQVIPNNDPSKFSDNDTTDTIAFSITGAAPGFYLVRVQVDGAESLLDVDTRERIPDPNNIGKDMDNPAFNTYIGTPKVEIK